MNLLKQLETEQMKAVRGGKGLPEFRPGDTLKVNVKVVEQSYDEKAKQMKTRERCRRSRACASARQGEGVNESFTVRKISYGEGVERVFPIYSPLVDSVQVVRKGRVRRAKLYYLRGRRGSLPASPSAPTAAWKRTRRRNLLVRKSPDCSSQDGARSMETFERWFSMRIVGCGRSGAPSSISR